MREREMEGRREGDGGGDAELGGMGRGAWGEEGVGEGGWIRERDVEEGSSEGEGGVGTRTGEGDRIRGDN